MTPAAVAAFFASHYGMPVEDVCVSLEHVGGGLESAVARAGLVTRHGNLTGTFIVKEMRGRHRREAEVYRLLAGNIPACATGRILGAQPHGDVDHLYMEDLGPGAPWPWADMKVAGEVCRLLARLHKATLPAAAGSDWDYEAELEVSAYETLETAARARDSAGDRLWRRLGDLRRLVDNLPHIRERLHAFGFVVIHGDVHPGNVIVRADDGRLRVVLIDWARARRGSPLEDVASWLQSLGCWEPEARRRHDSLLTCYLREFENGPRLSSPVRTLYWLAAASNGLSGAIRYHLAVLGNPDGQPDAARAASDQALRVWSRVIRRAAQVIRAGS